MLNQLPIKGNLGKDVQLAASGKAAYFSVATSKWIKENEFKTIWWECKVINQKLVNKVAAYKAGTTVKLTGEIDEEEYNGQKKKVLIVLEIDSIVKQQNNKYSQNNSNQGGFPSSQQESEPFGGSGSNIDISDDDLPF